MQNFTLSTAWTRYHAYHAKLTDALLANKSNIKKYNKFVTLEKKTGYFATFGCEVRNNERDVLLSIMIFDQNGVIVMNDVKNLYRTPWSWVRMGEDKRKSLLQHVVTATCYAAGIPLDHHDPMEEVADDVYALNVSWSDYEIYLGFLVAAQPQMELAERIKAYGSR